MKDCVSRLSNILQWKSDDVEILTRRAILNYRLRLLGDAKSDLDKAVTLSSASSLINLPQLDSLRYRCLVQAEIRDVEGALVDIQDIMRQTKTDPLTLSLRATIKAGKGDFEGAQKDLDEVQQALESGGGSQRYGKVVSGEKRSFAFNDTIALALLGIASWQTRIVI